MGANVISFSIYHDNKIGKPELKYVDDKGHELVFDGDTLEKVTDSKYIETYNYVPISDLNVLNYVGHFFADVLPYYIWGNTRDEKTTFLERTKLDELLNKFKSFFIVEVY